MGILGQWNLRRFKSQNTVEGWPASISGQLNISMSKGNRICFEEGVQLQNVSISFYGSGNTLIFGSKTNPRGRFIVNDGGMIEIGSGTRFNKPCWMQAHEGKAIKIGRDCLLADVRIRTSDIHKIMSVESGERTNHAKDVTIGNHVWIAEGAHIYKGVVIGDGSVIGAHAVVVRAVPGDCVAVGNPAAVVRENVYWR